LDTLRYVASVDVIDDYTVKVNFSKLQAGFLLPFAQRAGSMTSPTALEKNTREWFLTHTVGTGPFQFDNYVRDIKMDFKKFNGYWNQGKPYLDGLQWMTIADRTTALMSYKAGEAHTILYPAEKDRADLVKSGVNIIKIAGPIFMMLMDGGNTSSPFSNLKVRQAAAGAIDKAAVAQGLGYGYWEPVNQFSYPEHFSFNKDVQGYPYSVAKAKQLLTEAGYPNGFKTTIYGSGTTGYNELVQAYFKEIGIEATISLGTMANVAEWRQKGFTNGVQITPGGGPMPYIDSRVGVAIFSSTSGSYPHIFHSKDIDDLITASDKEMEQTKRIAIYQQLQKLIIDTYCVAVPIYRNPGTIAHSADVGYFNFQDATGASFEPADSWLKK
jgi:peptide/nickel transport system substrate-binding protein